MAQAIITAEGIGCLHPRGRHLGLRITTVTVRRSVCEFRANLEIATIFAGVTPSN
jgi:hypothetical protein